MKENLFKNICYMNNYKVFCFSNIYINNHSNEDTIVYNIGDFIPTGNYTYVYTPTLLVVDYINKIIHVIINNRYCEIVKLMNGKLELSTDSFLYKILFGKVSYKVIDIYGNFLKIKNIEDLIVALTTYPQVELYLINNKYLNEIDNNENYSNIIISDINYTNSESICYIHGYYKSNEENEEKMLIALANVRNTLQEPSIELYIDRWIDNNNLLNHVNELLLNIRLLYLLKKNKISKPITYYYKNEKYFTHIGRVENYIKEFMTYNDCDFIESILESIFLYIEFEEEYDDFLISTISKYADVKIV